MQAHDTCTFLVLGLDTHENNSPGQRSNRVIVVRVYLASPVVRTLLIPRDQYPGFGNGKINGAQQFGLAADSDFAWRSGAALNQEKVTSNFDVVIVGVALTDLKYFAEVFDAVSSIDVVTPYAVYIDTPPTTSM